MLMKIRIVYNVEYRFGTDYTSSNWAQTECNLKHFYTPGEENKQIISRFLKSRNHYI